MALIVRIFAFWFLLLGFSSAFSTSDSRADASGAYFCRKYILKSSNTGFPLYVTVGGDQFPTNLTPSGTTYSNNYVSASVAWTGLSSVNTGFETTSSSSSYTVSWRLTATGPVVGTETVFLPPTNCTINYVAGNQSNEILYLDPIVFTISPSGAVVVTDNLVNPPKVYGSGVLFLDNLTGIDQKSAFGSEEITLKPGYNSIPFTGELDSYGFPKAMPLTWALSKTVGPDGQVVWAGRIASGVEGGPPVWTQIQGPEIFAGVSGSGPSIKVPNGKNPALSDYVTLPAGMSKGAFNTLPGGMTAGSPGLPAGVTGGSSGALPSGVLSGGSAYLPSNVSAGTKAGQGGVTAGQVAGTGTTATTSGASTQGEAGGYIPGASMDGMLEKGIADGKGAAEQITTKATEAMTALGQKGNAIFGTGAAGPAAGYLQTGTGASAVGGADRSWLNVTIPIAQYNIPLVVPSHWIDLIRSILVWGVKIWFVVAVLKLLMR